MIDDEDFSSEFKMPKIEIYIDPSGPNSARAPNTQSSGRVCTVGTSAEPDKIDQFGPIVRLEKCKENIQPISQGRKIESLMSSLGLIDSKANLKVTIMKRREQFDADLQANKEEPSKQLDIWCEYIDWLEQNVPDGGKENGITAAIEQCIEQYHDKNIFKQDKRLFNIFMKFKRFCDEPTEVFGFMYANSISTLLANFYLNWSWQFEMKKNMKRAQDLLKLGIKNLASPREVLEEAECQLKARIQRLIQAGQFDELQNTATGPLLDRELRAELESSGIRAALQTLKIKVNKSKGTNKVAINRIGSAVSSNVGGLKSQTELVNGVVKAKKSSAKSASGSSGLGLKPENKLISIHTDENGLQTVLNNRKIPTSQRISVLGRNGKENVVESSGSLVNGR